MSVARSTVARLRLQGVVAILMAMLTPAILLPGSMSQAATRSLVSALESGCGSGMSCQVSDATAAEPVDEPVSCCHRPDTTDAVVHCCSSETKSSAATNDGESLESQSCCGGTGACGCQCCAVAVTGAVLATPVAQRTGVLFSCVLIGSDVVLTRDDSPPVPPPNVA